MGKDIEVEIFLEGGKKFKAQIKDVGKQTDKTAKSFSKAQSSLVSLNQGFQLLTGVTRIAARAIGALIDLGGAAIKAGSDFEEANQKFEDRKAGVHHENGSRVYRLLEEMGTKPNVIYLKKVDLYPLKKPWEKD